MFTFNEAGEFGSAIPRTGVLVQGDEIQTLETIELTAKKVENEQY